MAGASGCDYDADPVLLQWDCRTDYYRRFADESGDFFPGHKEYDADESPADPQTAGIPA